MGDLKDILKAVVAGVIVLVIKRVGELLAGKDKE